MRPIFTAPAGLHDHFPLWAPDNAFLYFVRGALPDKLDIWRIHPTGGTPERITSHTGRVKSNPVLLDRRTLLYLASDSDGSGPWLYSMDVERRIPHRLSSGPDRYTSLAASADGRRLVATIAKPKHTLWRLRIDGSPTAGKPVPISLATGMGYAPRLGPDYLLYVAATGARESIWKVANGAGTELWGGPESHVIGAPAISPDGRSIAFSVRRKGKSFLYTMLADGTNARIVADSLDLQGAPAWSPDGQSITSAAEDRGVPHLYRIPVDGRSPVAFVQEYSINPAWEPGGRFVVYSGPDIGTRFSIKAVTADAKAAQPLPALTLTRGARLVFLPGGHALLHLRGEIEHKNLWLMELNTGEARQLTDLAADFDVRDFDVSPDGREAVLERLQEQSDLVMQTLPAGDKGAPLRLRERGFGRRALASTARPSSPDRNAPAPAAKWNNPGRLGIEARSINCAAALGQSRFETVLQAVWTELAGSHGIGGVRIISFREKYDAALFRQGWAKSAERSWEVPADSLRPDYRTVGRRDCL